MKKYLLVAALIISSLQADDPLPSWKSGKVKQALLDFINNTTDKKSPKYIPEAERIATFDQDGTLWVEHPVYTQLQYCLDHAKSKSSQEQDLEKLAMQTSSGMSVAQFQKDVSSWLATAKHPRWQRPYTELTYLPMQELLTYFRASGYKTYIVTGGGQDFVRVYSDKVYGIPPEQVIGTAISTKFTYDTSGKPYLLKEPNLLLNDNYAGKPEGIHMMIGRRPKASFGNSTGDKEMLEYVDGLALIVLHDDAEREYAYGPAQNLPDTEIGTFTQELYNEAKAKGWLIVSMKSDWKKIFSFEE